MRPCGCRITLDRRPKVGPCVVAARTHGPDVVHRQLSRRASCAAHPTCVVVARKDAPAQWPISRKLGADIRRGIPPVRLPHCQLDTLLSKNGIAGLGVSVPPVPGRQNPIARQSGGELALVGLAIAFMRSKH